MRIAVVTETYPPEVNGVSLTVQGLVNGMTEDGHEMLARAAVPAGCFNAAVTATDSRTARERRRAAEIPRLEIWISRGPRPKKVVRRAAPGCSLCRDRRTTRLVRRANRASARHSVATGFHTRFDAYAGAYGLGPLTPLVRYWLRRLHNASGATVVPTPELREWLERHGFQRVRVVARGVDAILFDPARRRQKLRERWGVLPDGLAVIYVGRIAAEKNLSLAIEAFRRIREKRPDARFIWVGTGPLAVRLRQEHPDFIFAGLRLGEDLAEHFASADLFLFPSQTETFGNVTIEAMASGVPTIAFDYGAVRAHLCNREHGRFVASGDDAAFIAAAVEVATDAGQRRLMSAAARRVALALKPERVAREFIGMLRGLPVVAT